MRASLFLGHSSCHAENRLGRQMHIKPMKIKIVLDNGHVVPKIDCEGICTSSGKTLKCAGPVTDTYRYLLRTENAMFILHVFCLRN